MQYNLVPANRRWCLVTGKVTVGLASHWPYVTDISGSPITDSMPRRGRWTLGEGNEHPPMLSYGSRFTICGDTCPFRASMLRPASQVGPMHGSTVVGKLFNAVLLSLMNEVCVNVCCATLFVQLIVDHPKNTLWYYKMAKMEHTCACLTVQYIKLVWISTKYTKNWVHLAINHA